MDIIHNAQWAKTANGLNIELYHSPQLELPSSKAPILFIGGTHGDEPEGVRLAEDLLNYLKSRDNRAIPSDTTWALIPCLNPEGYKAQQRTNSQGVDLNRNYPAKNWIKEHKEERYFPGTAPASELETQALVAWITKHKPRLIIHFHSWEPCIVHSGEAHNAAQWLAESSGYELKTSIGYETPGSLSSYGWQDNNISVICTEEQEHSNLDDTWNRFGPGLVRILREF